MSGAVKGSKSEKAQAIKVVKLQKEVDKLHKENESLKGIVKQKDARLAVLSADFHSSGIRQNMVEAFDMENMFRQAAIDAQQYVERLLKTVQIKPEDFEEVKADLVKTKRELTAARKEKSHTDKQLQFKTKECETLLEEKRCLTMKTQTMPNVDDFRTLEQNYRCRLIALKDELKQKNFIIDQYTNTLPSIFSKNHSSSEYQRLEEQLQEATKTVESLSCVLRENEHLKTNILKLEREREELRECIHNLERETHNLKQKLHEHEQFERSLPPDAKTTVVLQEELVAKDLALKRQHDDFVKQLNEMNGTVSYLRLQYDKHMCVQNELERKKKEIVQLQDEARQAAGTIEVKEQQIKQLENHFNIRRSGLHHTVVGLEKKLKSTQLDLNESKRTIVKLLEENKKIASRCLQTDNTSTIQFGASDASKDSTVEIESYRQQLLDEKQKFREEKRNHWKANERVKQLEIACQTAFEKLVLKEKEAQSKQQTQRILLERKDRTINELRKLILPTDYASKFPKLKTSV